HDFTGIERRGAGARRPCQARGGDRAIRAYGAALELEPAQWREAAGAVQELRRWIDLEWARCEVQRSRLACASGIGDPVARDRGGGLRRADRERGDFHFEIGHLPANTRDRQVSLDQTGRRRLVFLPAVQDAVREHERLERELAASD